MARRGEEKVLQALVLADSFDERFMPLTLDRPRCLLPLCNVPLLDYTLEALAVAGVQEVFVYCVAHAEQIRQWVARSRWASGPMVVRTVSGNDAASAGDALRDVDARALLCGDADFFLVHCADVVTNADLRAALAHHRRLRSSVDRGFALTMVLAQAGPHHAARGPSWPSGPQSFGGADGDGVFALDARTGEVLAYAQPRGPSSAAPESDSESPPEAGETTFGSLDGGRVRARGGRHGGSASSIRVPVSRVAGATLRYDLLDAGVDVCSPSVLALFTENFDYADVRRDLVRGVLASEMLGVRVAAHVLPARGPNGGFAVRARSPAAYDAAARALIGRWAFPLCVSPGDAVVSRAAVVAGSLLGDGAYVGERSRVASSVLGPRVHVGADAVVEGSHVWAGARIGDGCVVRGAIIGDGAVVHPGTRVSPGVVVAAGVVFGGAGVVLPCGTRVAKLGEHVDARCAPSASLGPQSDGVLWGAGEVSPYGIACGGQRIRYADEPLCSEESSGESESEDSLAGGAASLSLYDDDSASLGTSSFGRNAARFAAEAYDLVRHAVSAGYALDNALLELNSLKFSCNATLSETRRVVLRALLAEAMAASGTDGSVTSKAAEAVFEPWAGLLERFARGGAADQAELLAEAAAVCAADSPRALQHVVPVLYKADVVDADAVLEWHAALPQASLTERQVRPFVSWLLESDPESSD